MDAIVCQNIWKIFNEGTPAEVQAIRGIDLKVKEGEFVAIMGSSGSGKSTLLNCITCLDVPTRGKIFIDGRDVSKMDENSLAYIRREKIGFVFQFFNLIPSLTALQNVELPMIFSGMDRIKRRRRAKELLESVGLGKRLNSRPSQLSGGETQRVAISRSMANNPTFIVADEPTGNLDSKSGGEIMQIFEKLNKDGRTVIMVTHDPKIGRHAKRLIRLQDGTIIK